MVKHTFDYGITHTWLVDGSILQVEAQGDMRREAIDSWANSILLALDAWPEDKPIFVLHKLDHPNQGFTPYSRKRAQDLTNAVPKDRPSYAAVVLRNNFVNTVIAFFLRSLRGRGANHEEQVFADYDAALDWLKERQTTLTNQ
jgi:hypothetical protein